MIGVLADWAKPAVTWVNVVAQILCDTVEQCKQYKGLLFSLKQSI